MLKDLAEKAGKRPPATRQGILGAQAQPRPNTGISTSGKHSFTLEHLRTPQMPWDALGHPGHQSTQGILYFSQG